MMNLKSSKEEVSNPSELKVVEAEVVMESPEVLKVKSRPVKKVDVRKNRSAAWQMHCIRFVYRKYIKSHTMK